MKFSVIIPVFNAEKHLIESINSVLGQTYSDFELIVINDGSTDSSLSILQKLSVQDNRIRIIDQENSGTAGALNRGLNEATQDWVFIMHADDIMLPNRLERQIAFLKDNPDIRVSSCFAYYISDKGKRLGKTNCRILSREQFNWHLLNNEAIGILHPGVVLHRETVLSVGGYRQPFWPAEDIDLWNRLAEQGHLIMVQDEVLMLYRIHKGSASTSQFILARMRYEWGRACMLARRANKAEPSWEEFETQWENTPLWTKWNHMRKTNAKAYYHAAGHDCLCGDYLRGISKLCLASALQPSYVLPRLAAQILP
jgi:glycosyltransferase involved in cell wall biosynthesis